MMSIGINIFKEEAMETFKNLLARLAKHKTLLKALTVVFVVLMALMFTLSGIVDLYAPVINQALGIETDKLVPADDGDEERDTYYYKSDYTSLQEMYTAKVQLLREIGQEGTVLLKNDGVLPIKSGKVAILGEDAFRYETNSAGGTIKIDHSLCTSLSGALKESGLTVQNNVAGLTSSDTVIVVVGRSGGEGSDLAAGSLALTSDEQGLINMAKSSGANVVLLVSGDYAVEIDSVKKDAGVGAIVRFGNAGYRGAYGLADVLTGVVSPSGKLVDTFAVSSMSSPAMANFGDMEYTNARRITGNYVRNYVVYQEGIYTDYKYYETRYEDCVLGNGNADSTKGSLSGAWDYNAEVSYPFGYGLSYTTFSKEIVGTPEYDAESDTWTITVNVTNTGSVAGKEVVQIYAQTPYTQYDKDNFVEKSAVSLMGYGKTDTLQPGDSEEVEVTVHQQWLASYDYTTAKGYIMDAGDYCLSVGNGAHEAINNILALKGYDESDGMTAEGDSSLAVKIVPDIDATESEPDTEIYKSVYGDTEVTNAFDDVDINYFMEDADKIVYLSRNNWEETFPETLEITASDAMINSLKDTQKYQSGTIDTKDRVVVDEDITYQPEGYVSETEKAINLKGVPYESSAWDDLLDEMTLEEMSYMVANGRYTIPGVASIAFPTVQGNDNPTGLWNQYKYSAIDEKGNRTEVASDMTLTDGNNTVAVSDLWASMFSSEPVLAASFNDKLAARQGDMFAEDALYCGVTFIWGLGVNLHRTPYGGRSSEYFSADPILSTLMATAWNKATVEKGAINVIKHFAVNEQEANRNGVATFTNEQALRENYLRAFEGVTVYGDLKGLMTAYNRIGLICTASEYDLMTHVLRNEWGFDGYTISDLYSPTAGIYDGDAMVAAGTNIMLNGGQYDAESGAANLCSLNVEAIRNDPVLLTQVREACHRMIYTFVNSNVMNGVDSNMVYVELTPFYIPLVISLMVIFTLGAVICGICYIASNFVKKEDNQHE